MEALEFISGLAETLEGWGNLALVALVCSGSLVVLAVEFCASVFGDKQ